MADKRAWRGGGHAWRLPCVAAGVLTLVGCGSDDPGAASGTAPDASVPTDGSADTGGSGGHDATPGDSFESAWKKAGSTGSGVETNENGLPGRTDSDQAPMIVSAEGERTEKQTSFTIFYRAAYPVSKTYVAPQNAGYRFEVSTTQPESPSETESFSFAIPLPSNLKDYAVQGITLPLGLAIEDSKQRVSNNVLLELSITLTQAGGIQGTLGTKQFCQTTTPPYCFLSTAVACASDGSSYNLETCVAPQQCESGECSCPADSCTVEGRECGASSCGTECGSCPPANEPTKTFCNEQGLCVEDPATVGCSDGTREGFVDKSIYPGIASCEASWQSQSLRATRTGQACGNSLGACTVPEDACAAGWHICMRNGWPGDLTDRISGDDCFSPVAGPNGYLAASSYGSETGTCTTPLTCHGNSWREPICCGPACSGSSDCVWAGQTRYAGYVSCNSVSSTDWGVLCCKDPPISGH